MAKLVAVCFLAFLPILFSLTEAAAQSLGGAGTLSGTVRDPSDAPVPSATVELSNPVSGFSARTRTGPAGTFLINNIPQNNYRLRVSRTGFDMHSADVAVRTVVPIDLNIRLALASQHTSVTVEAAPDNLVENKATASDTARLAAFTSQFSEVPEPGTLLLFGIGLGGLAAIGRRRR